MTGLDDTMRTLEELYDRDEHARRRPLARLRNAWRHAWAWIRNEPIRADHGGIISRYRDVPK